MKMGQLRGWLAEDVKVERWLFALMLTLALMEAAGALLGWIVR